MKNVEDVYPLSPMQQGLLFHTLYSHERGSYVEQVGWTVAGNFNKPAFEHAWRHVVARHPALRTCFFWADLDQPFQVVRRETDVSWYRHDWSGLSFQRQQKALETFLESDRRLGFDVSKAPLMRLSEFRLPGDAHQFIWTYHHLILDGWSISLVLNEVFQCYQALCNSLQPAFGSCRPFRDYIAWLQLQDTKKAESFWREQLQGVVAPTSLTVEKTIDDAGQRYDTLQLRMSPEATAHLREAARSSQYSLSVLVTGAWALLLANYSNSQDVVFGMVVTGRPPTLSNVENMVGLFINTLPLRVTIPPQDRVVPWLRNLQVKQVEMRQYEHPALSQIHEWSSVPRGQQLFRSIVAFDNAAENQGLSEGQQQTRIKDVFRANSQTNYPLTLSVVAGSELTLNLTYDESCFDGATMARMMTHLENSVVRLADAERIADVSLLGQDERQQLLYEWNDTLVQYPQESIPELFRAQVELNPQAVAVTFEGENLSYLELDRLSDQLAHYLLTLGVGPEKLVAIYAERSLEMVWSILGILKAGAAYLPIDPKYPHDVLTYMLQDSQVSVVLTQAELVDRLPENDLLLVVLDEQLPEQRDVLPPVILEPENLAYAIYTSGSTGKPKAALNTHRGICNRLRWMQDTFKLTAEDSVLQKTPFTFDVSVWEFLWPLITGARLVVAKPEGHRDSGYLIDLIAREEITTIHFVPSMLRAFLDDNGVKRHTKLQRVICSGEVLPFELQQRFFGCLDAELHNLYGPTEAAIDVTAWECQVENKRSSVPIGRPISNIRIYLLNRELQPVPLGIPGELHIGGVGLARGYLNNPGLTAATFVPDPFSGESGGRLYKTGDLARYLPDGSIEFLGRLDYQVKLHGFRIELGEIEAKLGQHPAVREAVAVAVAGPRDDKRLVVYVTSATEPAPTPRELRRFLQERVPQYMVPAAFVILDHFPLTASGKINRLALPEPGSTRPDLEDSFVAPRNETEATLVAIWKEVLGLDQVGVNDNFFELGGDSIISMQVVSSAKQAALQLVPRDLFEHQTIAELATAVTSVSASVVEEQGLVVGDVPLTPIQRWFLDQATDPNHFNQAVLLTASRNLDSLLLQKAIEVLLAQHDALRLRFVESASGWQQTNAAREGATIFRSIDLSELSGSAQEMAFAVAASQLQTTLNISNGPLLQVALFYFGAAAPVRLMMIVHHLAVDGVSWRILLEDLNSAYDQLLRSEEVVLPPKTTSFQRWANLLAEHSLSDDLHKKAEYWETESRKVVQPLPHDFARGENTVASASRVQVSLSVAETQSLLQDAPRAYRLQVNDILLTAVAQVLTRWSGHERLLINLEGHGREDLFRGVDLTRTVGWFTTLFPVRLELGNISDGTALRSIKEQLRAVPNAGLDYGLLRYSKGATSDALRSEPADICFNYLGQFDQLLAESDLFRDAGDAPGPVRSLRARRKHLLNIDGGIIDGSLSLLWTYSENFHRHSTIQKLADDFIAALRKLIVHCQSPDSVRFTPSDFPLASLKQSHLEALISDGRTVEDIYSLSPMQEGMLSHALRSPGSEVYCEQMSFTLRGQLDVSAFTRAWQAAVSAHSILRTAFVWKQVDETVQVVYPHVEVPLEEHDWRGLAQEVQSERLDQFRHDSLRQGFDLSAPPLMNLTLFRTEDESFELIWTYHHILLDGWSVPLLIKEVIQRYGELRQGRQVPAVLGQSFRSYISWLHHQDLQKAEAFWRERLRGSTQPTPVIGQASLAAVQSEQESSGQQQLVLSAKLTSALRVLTREQHLTLNTLAQGCWALLLSKYSGESDVVFGATVSGRPPELAGAETMIGLFINTLPVRVELREESVLTWLKRLQAEQAEVSQYVYTPLAQLQRWSDLPRGVPLFETLIVFENYPIDTSLEQISDGLEIASTRNVERTDYALTLVVVPGEELSIKLLYDSSRFLHSTVTRMLSHLENILQAVATDVHQNLSDLRVTSDAEAHAALVEWNDTEREYPLEECFHHLVENRALKAADTLAVSCEGGERLSYAELNQRANQLAHYLRRFAVAPEVRVGICLARSAEMVIARLAVLKAGGAYISLDPEHPQARLAYMLEHANARVVITEESFADRLAHCADVVICVDKDREIIRREREDNLDVPMHSANLAYVYFTSGSTGKPKGVEIQHSGLVNLVTWHNRAYGIVSSDRKSQLSGLAFDASVWELWPYLVAGASVHIPSEETRASWPKLLSWMVTEAITVCFLPTPLAEAVIADEWPAGIALRAVLTGGDKLHHWPQNKLPFSFVNKYGPTEVSAVTTWAPMHPTSPRHQSPPIGRPIANTETFVLDKDLQPVPIGVPGELYIGGIGLARGYVNQPDLTAEKFIPHPFGNEPGQRLYKSGDLVCYLPDGNLEFLGRHDSQVKIRGYRIELSEIEKSLLEHPAIKEAVVLVSEAEAGVKHLGAYFVLAPGVNPEPNELREFLQERVPAYMVPVTFVSLVSLPLNRNGKIDRQALLSLRQDKVASSDTYVAPDGAMQVTLAEIWAQVLGVQRIGIHDNFFELGGDSISSIRIIARAGQKGIELSPNDLFLYPTINELAKQSRFGLSVRAAATVTASTPLQPATDFSAPASSHRLTSTDFPNADLSQTELNNLLAKLRKDDGV